jgi:hypothetical protein
VVAADAVGVAAAGEVVVPPVPAGTDVPAAPLETVLAAGAENVNDTWKVTRKGQPPPVPLVAAPVSVAELSDTSLTPVTRRSATIV